MTIIFGSASPSNYIRYCTRNRFHLSYFEYRIKCVYTKEVPLYSRTDSVSFFFLREIIGIKGKNELHFLCFLFFLCLELFFFLFFFFLLRFLSCSSSDDDVELSDVDVSFNKACSIPILGRESERKKAINERQNKAMLLLL